MSRINVPASIRLEDYDAKYRELVEKLSSSINPFMDEVYRQINGNINFENLNRQIVTIDVRINASSQVLSEPQIRTSLRSRLAGTSVISAQNLVNSNTYPTSQPFISYVLKENIMTITNISGLQANSQYRLTIELIGN